MWQYTFKANIKLNIWYWCNFSCNIYDKIYLIRYKVAFSTQQQEDVRCDFNGFVLILL